MAMIPPIVNSEFNTGVELIPSMTCGGSSESTLHDASLLLLLDYGSRLNIVLRTDEVGCGAEGKESDCKLVAG